jgi:hypothetical protein
MDAIVEVKPAGPHAADANIARVAQDGIYRAADHERSLAEQANAHVRRFEAQRRAGIVERVEEGVWRVPQDLVSQGNRYDRKRQGGIAVKIQSYLPLGNLPRVVGATWLDRELSRPSAPVSAMGFGAEVREALETRVEFLIERGFARRLGSRLIRCKTC